MSLENRKSAEKKLLEISEEKGYVTEDDISSTADDYSLSLIDYDWLTDDLYTRNILVKSEEDDSVSLVNPEQYKDYSQSDYLKLYQQVVSIDPGLKKFISEIKDIIPPQWKETKQLIILAQEGNNYAYERIILMNLRQVLGVAVAYYEHYGGNIADIIQDGIIGLMMAVNRYDPNKTGTFLSYAKWYILARIQRSQCIDNPIRLPAHQMTKYNAICDTLIKLNIGVNDLNYLGDDVNQILESIGVFKENDVEYILPLICPFKSIENEAKKYFYINDYKIYKYEAYEKDIPEQYLVNDNLAYEKEINGLVNKLLKTLSKRERYIISMRYGLYDGLPHTLEEVGQAIGLTRERIRQIETKCLKKLRNELAKINNLEFPGLSCTY